MTGNRYILYYSRFYAKDMVDFSTYDEAAYCADSCINDNNAFPILIYDVIDMVAVWYNDMLAEEQRIINLRELMAKLI